MGNAVSSCAVSSRLLAALRLQRWLALTALVSLPLWHTAGCARQLEDGPGASVSVRDADTPTKRPTASDKNDPSGGLARAQTSSGSSDSKNEGASSAGQAAGASSASAANGASGASGARDDAKAKAPMPPMAMTDEEAGESAADGAGRSGGTDAASGGASTDAGAPGVGSQAGLQCQPHAGKYTVLEGHKLTIALSCGVLGVSADTWELDALPSGADFDPATGALSWQPGLDQAARYEITARAMPWAEAASVEIDVIDAFDADDNEPPRDPTTYLEEYGLPVLHLTTDPGVNDDAYTPATIVYRGHTYTGSEAKFRGATSKSYPKRSFTLKFTKQDKFNEPALAGGFVKKRKITLITSFDDNSYLRQRLGYELWNRLDPSKHIHVQAYNAVVYLNGKYHGLYTIADHVDGYLMEDFGYDQKGNLYKARSYDGNFRALSGVNIVDGVAQPKATLHDGFSKEEGTPEEGQPGAFDDLDAFVDWAASSSAADFAAQIDTTIARKEYEDWWIWSSYIRADDSAGKNSYHYRDPLRSDSVWHFAPWDLNASFGQDWKTMRAGAQESPPDAWFRSVNGLFDRMLSDSTLGPALRKRYGVELAGPLAGSKVLELFDAMVEQIDQSALRDEQKWQSQYRGYMLWRDRTDFTTYKEEVEYVRRWISERQQYLEGIY